MDIWEDLGDLATGSVGIQLHRECGLNTIASGVRAKQSPGLFFNFFFCLFVETTSSAIWLQKG